jgi:hypothetical protein
MGYYEGNLPSAVISFTGCGWDLFAVGLYSGVELGRTHEFRNHHQENDHQPIAAVPLHYFFHGERVHPHNTIMDLERMTISNPNIDTVRLEEQEGDQVLFHIVRRFRPVDGD